MRGICWQRPHIPIVQTHLLRLYTSIQLRAVELVTASGEVLRAQKDDPDVALREVSMLWDVFRSLVNPCSL